MACCDEVSSLQPATLCALLATRPVAPLVGTTFNAFDPTTCTITTVTLPTFVETDWVGIEGVAIDILPGGVAGHNPTIGVRVSTDPFNNVTLGTDGGLYVAPAIPGPQTPITPIDTCSINLTASGLDNHTLQADVNLSAAGNPLCGDQNAGAPIYCSPTGLRTLPTCTAGNVRWGNAEGYGGIGFGSPDTTFDRALAQVFFANPSACRSFIGQLVCDGSSTGNTGGTAGAVTFSLVANSSTTISPASYAYWMGNLINQATGGATVVNTTSNKGEIHDRVNLAPGAVGFYSFNHRTQTWFPGGIGGHVAECAIVLSGASQ